MIKALFPDIATMVMNMQQRKETNIQRAKMMRQWQSMKGEIKM